MRLLFVGMGGFLGAISRYLVSGWVQRAFPGSVFPYGTLSVNVIGCVFIGILGGLAETRQLFSTEMRAFLLIGLLGGFTTFSTFGFETYQLLKAGELFRSAANIIVHIFFAFAGVWIGLTIANFMGGK